MRLLLSMLLLLVSCGTKNIVKYVPYRTIEVQNEVKRARENLLIFNNSFSFKASVYNNGNVNLFQGLLCSVHEQWACDTIRDMQLKYKYLCRSWEACLRGDGVSDAASRDELLGRLLYWTVTNDFENVPDNNYIVNGKICKNSTDKRCNVDTVNNPAIFNTLHNLGRYKVGLPQSSSYTYTMVNTVPVGYQLHLQAVTLYINTLQGTCGKICKESIKILVKRNPNNEFYQFLSGNRNKAVDLFLEHTKQSDYKNQNQWWTQRDTVEKSWLQGNAATTIFLGDLLSN